MSGAFPAELNLECGPVGALDLALFAAGAGDHNPLHLDPDVARAAGFERPVVHGMLTMAYVGRLFTQSFGAGSVRSLHTKFTGAALRGDCIRITATLQSQEGGVARYAVKAATLGGQPLVEGEARVAAGGRS